MGKKRYSKDTRLIILDWDGVAYPYTLAFANECATSLVHQVVADKHPELTGEEVQKKEKKVLHKTAIYAAKHKGEFAGYFEEKYGMDEDEVLGNIREQMKHLRFIEPSPELRKEIIAAQEAGVKVVILSDSPTAWLKAGVEKLGISDLIGDEALFGKDKTRHNKREGTEAYQYVLGATGFAPEETVTVDDSKKNLRQALKLGIDTAYIPKVWRLHTLKLKHPEEAEHAHRGLLEFFQEFNKDIGKGRDEHTPGWQSQEDSRKEQRRSKRPEGR